MRKRIVLIGILLLCGMSFTIGQDTILNTQTIQNSLQSVDAEVLALQKSLSMLRWIVFALIALIILMCALLFLFSKRMLDSQNKNNILRQFVESAVVESDAVFQKLSWKMNSNGGDVQMYEDKLNSLERKIGNLQEQVNKTLNMQKPEDVNPKPSQITNERIKFFRTKQGKILQDELPTESGASFKIFEINASEAKFEYCGGVTNPDFFDGICDFANNPADIPHKTKIITVSPGKVKKDNDNWIIDKPAKIKFI